MSDCFFENPRVSIIIPVYNCERYITTCLQSIKAQTLQDWEAIVVHHDSIDNSLERIIETAGKDPRFRIFDETGLSISAARNYGMDRAQGAFIGFVDADDWVEPQMYQKLLNGIEHSKADFVACGYFMEYPKMVQPISLFDSQETVKTSEIAPELVYLRYLAGNPNVWNKLYRKSFLLQHHMEFQVNQGEDLLFHLNLLKYLDRIFLIPEPLYHYRQRKSSLMHDRLAHYSKDALNILEVFLRNNEKWENDLLSCYTFANVFTGMMFLPACMKESLHFFVDQISLMRQYTFFPEMCEKICRTSELRSLYWEKAISIRFYWTIKAIFSLCYFRCDYPAAMAMWLASRMILFKKRHLQPALFE